MRETINWHQNDWAFSFRPPTVNADGLVRNAVASGSSPGSHTDSSRGLGNILLGDRSIPALAHSTQARHHNIPVPVQE